MATGFTSRWKGKVAVPYGNFWQSGIKSGAAFLSTGAPSTTALANAVPVGGLVIDQTNALLYLNIGTLAAPVFGALGGGGAISASTTGTTLAGSGVSVISSTGVAAAFPVAAPTAAGQIKRIEIIANSSAVFLVASTAGSAGVTFDGTNTVIKSTLVSAIELVSVSTTRWNVHSAYPPSTAGGTILTLSTTT